MTRDLRTRFMEKFSVDENGCWIWTGHKAQHGYSRIWRNGKMVYAHRVSYELHKGPIPDGLCIDHLCRVRACVNPDHLEAVTNEENIARGEWGPAANVRKTHCKHGHPLSGENVYAWKNKRFCRACMRAYDKKRENGWARSAKRHATSNVSVAPAGEEGEKAKAA